jgi:hypothetical protein
MATPVAAEHKDSHNPGGQTESNSKHENNKHENNERGNAAASNRFDADDVDDCEDEAKNHGQYVSCVVHLIKSEGDDVSARDIGFGRDECDDYANLVACAAHDDIGKDDEDEED